MEAKPTKLPPMHLACDNCKLRDALNYVYINNGIATATNAHIMVRVKLDQYMREDVLAALDGKVIHMETWKALKRSQDIALIDGALMYRTDNWGLVKIPVKKREDLSTKLGWEVVWKEVTERPAEIPEFLHIGIKPTFLTLLDSVINFNKTYGLSLFFGRTANKPILVKPIHHDSAMGIIMPVMVHDDYNFNSFKI
jgi:hypothetical protein